MITNLKVNLMRFQNTDFVSRLHTPWMGRSFVYCLLLESFCPFWACWGVACVISVTDSIKFQFTNSTNFSLRIGKERRSSVGGSCSCLHLLPAMPRDIAAETWGCSARPIPCEGLSWAPSPAWFTSRWGDWAWLASSTPWAMIYGACRYYKYHNYGRSPVSFSASAGYRYLADNNTLFRGEGNPYVRFNLVYGDPFDGTTTKPYDYFTLDATFGLSSNQPLIMGLHLLGRLHSCCDG